MGKIANKKPTNLKRSTRRRLRLALRTLGFCLFLILSFFAYQYLLKPVLKSSLNSIYSLTSDIGFEIKYVEINGLVNSNKQTIQKLSGIIPGQPIFAIDIHEARKRILTNDWIKEAVIERQLPDTIFIKLTERTPIALWQNGRELSLIDSEGNVFKEKALMNFLHLPIVIGDDAPIRAVDLFNDFQAHPELIEQIKSLTWISERRWNISLKNGMLIKLPEADVNNAWEKLAEIANGQEFKANAIKEIDFRLPDKIYIKK
jgi:cell division protein FtsQ